MGTFSYLKKVKVKTYNKVTQFSAQSDIFGKISLIQQNRKINLQEIFSYPLGPIPWALAEANSELKKSSKAKIMHELEKGVTRVERVDAPFVPIFDGMALVRIVKCTGLTCNQFVDDLLKLVVDKSCRSKRMTWCLMCSGRIQSKMLKEEIDQLVKFSSMSSLAPLRSHNGALFYQTTKANLS